MQIGHFGLQSRFIGLCGFSRNSSANNFFLVIDGHFFQMIEKTQVNSVIMSENRD